MNDRTLHWLRPICTKTIVAIDQLINQNLFIFVQSYEEKVAQAMEKNKAGYTVTEVVYGWAGAVIKELAQVFRQEQSYKNNL